VRSQRWLGAYEGAFRWPVGDEARTWLLAGCGSRQPARQGRHLTHSARVRQRKFNIMVASPPAADATERKNAQSDAARDKAASSPERCDRRNDGSDCRRC